ncbi:MAG: hypothetical protein RR295_05965 [Oscillospiraceae bacterium]
MLKLQKRLCSARGETMVETLCAILIIVFSSLILMTMALTAANINGRTAKADVFFRLELIEAEKGGGTKSGNITIRNDSSHESYQYDVLYTSGEQLHSYDKPPRAEGGSA